MKSAGLAIVVSSAILAVTSPDAQAGGRGGIAVRGHGGGIAPRTNAFHHHPHTRVLIGGSFFFWPGPYPYYPAPYSYYAPAAEPAAPLMVDPYWYYCEEAAAYYPYVKECAGGWLPVLPSSAPTG